MFLVSLVETFEYRIDLNIYLPKNIRVYAVCDSLVNAEEVIRQVLVMETSVTYIGAIVEEIPINRIPTKTKNVRIYELSNIENADGVDENELRREYKLVDPVKMRIAYKLGSNYAIG